GGWGFPWGSLARSRPSSRSGRTLRGFSERIWTYGSPESGFAGTGTESRDGAFVRVVTATVNLRVKWDFHLGNMRFPPSRIALRPFFPRAGFQCDFRVTGFRAHVSPGNKNRLRRK